MKYNSRILIEGLQADVRRIIFQANQLQHLSPALLTAQPGFRQWSPAQVLDHLNIYARHYLPAIEEALHLHASQPSTNFRPGWLGDYFTKLMQPDANSTVSRKMSAPKNALPSSRPDVAAVLQEFLQSQHQLLTLLEIAKSASLGTIRIPTSLHKLIRLKIGDTFRFFIAHEQRHFIQLQNALAVLKEKLPAAA